MPHTSPQDNTDVAERTTSPAGNPPLYLDAAREPQLQRKSSSSGARTSSDQRTPSTAQTNRQAASLDSAVRTTQSAAKQVPQQHATCDSPTSSPTSSQLRASSPFFLPRPTLPRHSLPAAQAEGPQAVSLARVVGKEHAAAAAAAAVAAADVQASSCAKTPPQVSGMLLQC